MMEEGNSLQTAEFGRVDEYLTWLNTLIIANSIIGLMTFEWSWYKTRRHRKPIRELNKQFCELYRTDAHNW